MRTHILSFIALVPVVAGAQVPAVRLLNAPDASSKPEFAVVAAVRQLAGGRLLVNDIQNRQLTILDPGLANAFILADSMSGQLNSYGIRAGGLIRYVGDSTLFHRSDMVEAGWAAVAPILDVWQALTPRNFPSYAANTWGPKEADDLITRDGRKWRSL